MRLSNETPKWETPKWRQVAAWLVLSVAGLCLGTVALADERHRGDWKSDRHRSERYEHREHRGHRYSADHRHADRGYYAKHRPKYKHAHSHRHAGWHYQRGRYWAPASYRGRYCSDRRHYHGVHYHVAFDDYYEYYYPRYRYYGPHAQGASLIITLPLF